MATTITANGINFPDGSAGSPSIGGTDTNTGLFTGSDIIGFSTGGSERLRIDDSGRLLVGATSIGSASSYYDDLVISNTTSGTGAGLTFIANATNGFSAIDFADTAAGGRGRITYSHGDDDLRVDVAGSERMRITSSGKLAIGTTTPYTYGIATFHDSNGIVLEGSSQGRLLFRDTGGGTNLKMFDLASSDGVLKFRTIADNGTTVTERMRIDSAGNVGIGTTPNNVGNYHTLHIKGPSNEGAGIRLQDNGDTADSDDFTIYKNSTAGYLRINGSDPLVAYMNNAERMRIDSSGRLLVGTDSARAGFNWTTSTGIQAEGSYNHGSISSTNNENNANACAYVSAKIRGTGAVVSGDIVGSHDFQAFEGTAFRQVARIDGIAISSGGISNNVISGDLAFSTRVDALSPFETMRLSHARLAFFGCNGLPSGTIAGCSIDSDPSDLPVYWKSSSRQHSANAYTHTQFFNNNGAVGGIMTQGSGTAFQTSSDYRLKENETAITDGVTRLKQLKPYKFNFKADSTTVLDGFFAHEVSSIVPDAVSGDKDYVATAANVKSGLAEKVGDPIYQQIDHSKLVPLLTAALQEAIAKIETLETKVAALEAE